MENAINAILANKDEIVKSLYSWATTFDCELDVDGQESDESFNTVNDLAIRLENNLCTSEDYENILFHIEQINDGEIVIDLGIN